MADATYQTKIRRESGGDKIGITSGGEIDIESGVAALYAAAGTAVNDGIAVAKDRIKIVVAQGGNVKSGAFHVVVG